MLVGERRRRDASFRDAFRFSLARTWLAEGEIDWHRRSHHTFVRSPFSSQIPDVSSFSETSVSNIRERKLVSPAAAGMRSLDFGYESKPGGHQHKRRRARERERGTEFHLNCSCASIFPPKVAVRGSDSFLMTSPRLEISVQASRIVAVLEILEAKRWGSPSQIRLSYFQKSSALFGGGQLKPDH